MPLPRRRADETIVAVATPLGAGGLGVVRLSGPQAIEIADSCFASSKSSLKGSSSHTLHVGWIKTPAGVLDQVVAGMFKAPHSYTGEDVVEFSTHGSPQVLKELVEICLAAGARSAEPGEFTERAFLNGRMDLAQAEAVAELISAHSRRARENAVHQLRGALSERLREIRRKVIDLTARLEANLDFVEEDIPGLPRPAFVAQLDELIDQVGPLVESGRAGGIVREGVRLALIGRPNVGKSSLFNALLGAERAIVTEIPGTTRDTIEERAQWDGFSVVLTDTAGVRETADVVERHGTRRSWDVMSVADLILFVIDGSEPLKQEDQDIAAAISGRAALIVCNKADRGVRISEGDRRMLSQTLKTTCWIECSAVRPTGLEDIRDQVTRHFAGAAGESEHGFLITNRRHLSHLEAVLAALRRVRAAGPQASEESVSLDLRAAVDEIDAITGERLSDDILDSIFRQFCIGK